MFKSKFLFVPFGVSRIRVRHPDGYIGYADYLIFGFRVARIQETRPY